MKTATMPDRPEARGRPRVFLREIVDLYKGGGVGRHRLTDRHSQNVIYAHKAMDILDLASGRGEPLPAPTWLVDWEGAERGKQGAIKYGVLTELGRMSAAGFPDDYLRAIAERLAEIEWTVKEAEQQLREVRLRGYREGQAPPFTETLDAAVTAPAPPP